MRKQHRTPRRSSLSWWPTKTAHLSTSVTIGWRSVFWLIQRQEIWKKKCRLLWPTTKIHLLRLPSGSKAKCLISRVWSTLWEAESLSWRLNSQLKARSVITKKSLRSFLSVKLRWPRSGSRRKARKSRSSTFRPALNKPTWRSKSTESSSTSSRSTRASSQLTGLRRTRWRSTQRCSIRCQFARSQMRTWLPSSATRS